jgi:adenylate kinase family enzyme
MKRPILILMRGLPGSGKTYIAQHLLQVLESKEGVGSVLMLDPDAIENKTDEYVQAQKQFAANGIEEKFHPYRYLRGKAERAIEKQQIIIWNQPFTFRPAFERTITHLTSYASKNGVELPVLIVEVEVDQELAYQRTVARKKAGGHGPSKERFNQFVDEYVSFSDLGPAISVSGADDVQNAINTIKQALTEL